MDGWIKIHRKFVEWEWFEDSEMVHLFLYLLLKANHKENKWKGILIKRGTLITSRSKLSEATKIPEQTIRTCINRLKRTNEITTTTDSTKQFTIITICNYDSYQEENTSTNQPPTNHQPTTNQPPTTNKNDNNKKNDNNSLNIPNGIFAKKEEFENIETSTLESENPEKEEKVAPKEEKKKFAIPTIEEVGNFCKQRNNNINPTTFWHFYNSKDWMIGKQKMKSWQSCIITWETKEKNKQQSSNQNNQQQEQPLSIRAQRARELLGGQI